LEPVGYGRSFTNKYDGIGIAGYGCGAPMERLQQMIIAHGAVGPASGFAFASGYANPNATTETRVNQSEFRRTGVYNGKQVGYRRRSRMPTVPTDRPGPEPITS
jgi:hypothetical protein